MDCVFCKIAKKEIPSNIVWEDENFIAFFDIKPLSKGHTLIIPKKHFRWVWDVENYSEYFEKVKEVKKILDEKYKPLWTELKIMGNEIPHAHIHLIPHYQL